MRFLKYHYSRNKLNYEELHEMSIEELVRLRNAIKAFQKMNNIWTEYLSEYVEFKTTHPDFHALRMNPQMMPEVLDSINGMIGKRNMATIRERREQKENKEK